MIWFAIALLAVTALVGAEAVLGLRALPRMDRLPPWSAADPPRVSLIVAARDEVRSIQAAVGSMLTQTYPALEIVVVDDRSTDGTGALLDRMDAAHPELRVLHVSDLPAGWLGKNHALQVGADHATGAWLLFIDADVHLAPDTIARAVRYAEKHRVDHLTATPELELPGFLLSAFAVFFAYAFVAFAKPWKAKNPRSRHFIGVGAFNLVRRSAYRAVDGHRQIALRPDDDMKLGKVLKRHGFRQDALHGAGTIRVAWYHSFREMVQGLEKNMFAGVDYNVFVSVGGGLLQLTVGVLPLVLLFLTGGSVRLVLGLQIFAAVLSFALVARVLRQRAAVALAYPLTVLLFVAILWRTMVLNLAAGGLTWRGTFYSLKDLKANRI